jgi:hypothetical protein
MNNINSRILITVVVYILLTIISFSVGWWIIGLALLAGGGFILYRISGPSVGITQLDFLKKIPGNKSWWTYGLVALSTLYYVLLGFGVLKWEWVQFNVLIMLLIIAFSSVLAGSKDISSSLQGVMRLWTVLSIAGIIILIIATRFSPELVQNLDYSHSSTPPTEQSAGQQELVTPSPTPTPEYTHYSARGGRELKSLSQEIEIAPYSEELCLSFIKDTYGFYISQNVLINGKEFLGGESSRSSECHPLDEFGGVEKKKKVKVRVEIPRIMSPIKGGKENGDLYKFVQEQGGEASYPVIRPK